MRTHIAIAALVASASVTSAQDTYSLDIVAPTTVDASMASFDIMVVANSSFGTHALGGAFSMTGTDANGAIAGMDWTNSAWSSFNEDNGWSGGANYNKIIFGQLVLPGVPPFDVPAVNSDFPDCVVGTFTVDLTGFVGTINLQLAAESPFALEAIDTGSGATANSSNGTLTLGSATITIVPAPASAALLGLGGIAVTRRRR